MPETNIIENIDAAMVEAQAEPMMIDPGEFSRRMAVVKVSGKPMSFVPRTISQIVGIELAEMYKADRQPGQSSVAGEPVADHSPFMRFGSTAVISLDAPIFYTASIWAIILGGMSNSNIVNAVIAAREDEQIHRVVFDMHCPGGEVSGMSDIIGAVNSLAASKPVISLVHDRCASAAVWIAASTHRIVSTPTGTIGSIGTIAAMIDESEAYSRAGFKPVVITDSPHKALGRPGVPIDEKMIAKESELIRDISAGFRNAVTRKTKISDEELSDMGGSMHHASDAVKRGLCDEINMAAEFYSAVDAGEYDQYGPGKNTTTNSTLQSTSGRSVAQNEDRPMSTKYKAQIDAMSADDRKTMMAELAAVDDDETTASTEDDETAAETTDDETTASTEDDETTDASEDENEDDETSSTEDNGDDDDDDDKTTASTAQSGVAKMTIAKAESILKVHKFPEAMGNKLVISAVKKNMSEGQLLSNAIVAMKSPEYRQDAGLEQEAAGSGAAIGGGAQSSTSANAAGKRKGADAKIDAMAASMVEENPSMTQRSARTMVMKENPELREQMIAEANA